MPFIPFKNSILEVTIKSVHTFEGLKRYKQATEGAVKYWKSQLELKTENAQENIDFFTEALNLCNLKIKKLKPNENPT